MSRAWGTYKAYRQVDVETASQGKLVVMMFNGAIQRAEAAKRGLAESNMEIVHESLVRAQDIIAELRGALDLSAAAVAEDIDKVYEYLGHLLIQANIKKSSEPIDEFLLHAEGLRDTWEEAFVAAERGNTSAGTGTDESTAAPTSRMNVTG